MGDDEIEVINAASAHRRDATRCRLSETQKNMASEVGNEQLTLALERSARLAAVLAKGSCIGTPTG